MKTDEELEARREKQGLAEGSVQVLYKYEHSVPMKWGRAFFQCSSLSRQVLVLVLV